MAATMHAKIDRKKLNKLNIIKICEEILNPKVPMALRLSGILMGGVAIVYERKVKLLYGELLILVLIFNIKTIEFTFIAQQFGRAFLNYIFTFFLILLADDVTRLMVEINEAWKVKNVPDPNVLSKGKSKAKKEAITLPENQEINMGDIEESLQFSNTAPTMGFQHDAYFTMRLDNVNEDLDFNNGAREEEDPSKRLHQVDVENITLFERFESFQANENLYNRFERFDIEGDDETFLNVTSTTFTQIPTTLVPSPPRQDEPSRADISQDHHPEHPVIQHSDEGVKEGQPTNIMSSTKIAKLMKIPPVALISDLYNNETGDIYYPAPLLDLWNKSTQPPHDSPSARASGHHPPEPSFSSPPVVHSEGFMRFPSQDFDGGLDNQFLAPPTEKPRDKVEHAEIFMDELRANLDFGLRAPLISSWKSGDSIHSFGSGSEHGSASHSDIGKGRFTKKRHSLSGNISGGLEPVAENAHVKLPRVSEMDPTPDQGPTQIQPIINQPRDVIADTIQAQMKAHFETPGVPPVESLDILAAGMTRKSAAALFYQTCVLASRDALKVEQKEPYGEILISRGSKM
ncbi:hypothetical protein TanjilG_29508 [Lupinus angustifolius]|uniref:Rad21/Rec8-like protein N-terminal domain-containing protein n=1 Tax=Lupinus angustifolius TaxID=3871 RepID=A0A4P1R5R4_LUPAN|nr:hypothetical protein TanjilG_29508 [Lupinus angustifolius]